MKHLSQHITEAQQKHDTLSSFERSLNQAKDIISGKKSKSDFFTEFDLKL